VRSYARFLGLDPEPMAGAVPVQHQMAHRSFGLGPERPRRLVLTTPAAVVIGLALLACAFGFYAWRQVEALNSGAATNEHPVAHLALPSPPVTPLPSASPQPRTIVVGVSVTDTVWLSVTVDGKSVYGDSGKILQPGSQAAFTGQDIKITSGKAAATFITIDGRSMGALGDGVVTREFKAT
jgi:hypothetical protein